MTPLIIEVAINGNTPKSRNPHVPISPAEIAADIEACIEAGASIIHNHIEDYSLNGESAARRFREGWEGPLKRAPDIIFSPTASSGETIEQRWSHNAILADWGLSRMAWLDPGSLNVTNTGEGGMPGPMQATYVNSFADIDYAVRAMERYRLGASIAIFEPGFLRLVLAYRRNGHFKQGALVRFYFGGDHNPADGLKGGLAFGLPPTEKALDAYLEMLEGSGLAWAVSCMGGDIGQSPAVRLAIARGGHVRVGLEDFAGPRQPTNRALVEEVVALAKDMGRPIATCAVARKILDLPR